MALTKETPDDPAAWLKLAAVCRMEGDRAAALAAATRAVAIAPYEFTALLLRADLLDAAGDPAAGLAFERALAQRPPGDTPPAMRPVIVRAEHARDRYLQARAERLAAAGRFDGLDPEQRARTERFASNAVRSTRVFHAEPTHFHFPGLAEREFHDRSTAPWLAAIEAETDAIAGELDIVMRAERAELVPYIAYQDHEPLAQWRALNHSADWSAIHLIRNGVEVAANARHCPRTMAALARLPQPHVAGCSPNAMFSLLAPGTVIPPHHGVTNTRLICHLPLVVPSACSFRVGATTREWRRGEAFLFDDTIEHEARNGSDALRVVLIFDVWHHGLANAERAAVGAMMAADVAALDAAAATGL